MKPAIRVRDVFAIERPDVRANAMDFIADSKSDLRVTTNASYSGYFIQNCRVYPGQNMMAGVGTWCSKDCGGTAEFNKPVLRNHNSGEDPIGRVVNASYHRILDGKAWLEDWKNPARGSEKGSGYTRLVLSVVDSAAQERFLDGRYATFSTNFSTPYAFCSICSEDINKGCEHEIGKEYEVDNVDRLCVLVTGPQNNIEVSVVNNPANPHATVDGIQMTQALKDAYAGRSTMADSEMSEMVLVGTAGPRSMALSVMDRYGKEYSLLKDGEPLPATKTQILVPNIVSDEDFALGHVAKKLVEQNLIRTDSEMADLGSLALSYGNEIALLVDKADGHQHSGFVMVDLAKKKLVGYVSTTYPSSKKAKVEHHSHSISVDIEDMNLDTISGSTDIAAWYDNEHVHDFEVVIRGAEDSADAPSYEKILRAISDFDKLTSVGDSMSLAQIRATSFGVFAGPGETFPIPDEAHVKACLRLLRRYKGTSEQVRQIFMNIVTGSANLMYDFDVAKACIEQETEMTKADVSKNQKESQDSKDPKDMTEDQKTIALLRDSLQREQARCSDLQSQLDTAKSDNKTLCDKLAVALDDAHASDCKLLALLRSVVSRPVDGHDLKTAAGQAKYVDELKSRSRESIRDSIQDEMASVVKVLPSLRAKNSVADPKIVETKPVKSEGALNRDTTENSAKNTQKPAQSWV